MNVLIDRIALKKPANPLKRQKIQRKTVQSTLWAPEITEIPQKCIHSALEIHLKAKSRRILLEKPQNSL